MVQMQRERLAFLYHSSYASGRSCCLSLGHCRIAISYRGIFDINIRIRTWLAEKNTQIAQATVYSSATAVGGMITLLSHPLCCYRKNSFTQARNKRKLWLCNLRMVTVLSTTRPLKFLRKDCG